MYNRLWTAIASHDARYLLLIILQTHNYPLPSSCALQPLIRSLPHHHIFAQLHSPLLVFSTPVLLLPVTHSYRVPYLWYPCRWMTLSSLQYNHLANINNNNPAVGGWLPHTLTIIPWPPLQSASPRPAPYPHNQLPQTPLHPPLPLTQQGHNGPLTPPAYHTMTLLIPEDPEQALDPLAVRAAFSHWMTALSPMTTLSSWSPPSIPTTPSPHPHTCPLIPQPTSHPLAPGPPQTHSPPD